MPDSEVSVGGVSASGGCTNTCLVGQHMQHTSETPSKTTKDSQVCSPEVDLFFSLFVVFFGSSSLANLFAQVLFFLPLSFFCCKIDKNHMK